MIDDDSAKAPANAASADDDGLQVDVMTSATIDNLQDFAHQDPDFGTDIPLPGQTPTAAAKIPRAAAPSPLNPYLTKDGKPRA